MSTTQDDRRLAATLDDAVKELELSDSEPDPGGGATIASLRRRRGAAQPSPLARVSLVRVDGELRWTYERPPRAVGGRRARRRAAHLVGANAIHSFAFEEIPPNKVIAGLESLDRKFTPDQGLRRWNGNGLQKIDGPKGTRALLFVHGTFGKGDVFFTELSSSPEGKDFLKRAAAHYKGQILSFDHPTLSVSPILNALDLEAAFAGYTGTVDVVCHSRGGLVVSWWLRTGKRPVGKVVFAASPLEGTSLAAPARLKDTLDGLANVAEAVEKSATAASLFVPPVQPILGVAAGLMKVLGGVLSLGARSPLLDAGVAVVPGLAAQSMVENNQELTRLVKGPWPFRPECFTVVGDFEPGDPTAPWWQFWKRWRRPLLAAADSAADHVFKGPNDLVVDTPCMERPLSAALPKTNILAFCTNNGSVHHCNYFAQPETAKFLIKKLGL